VWGRGWRRWRASSRASGASRALGTTDQGCRVFLGVLDAMTNTVVGVGEDAVESLALARKLRGRKGICSHGEHGEGKEDLGGGRHVVWLREEYLNFKMVPEALEWRRGESLEVLLMVAEDLSCCLMDSS
jgi:hypothetical protein